MKSKSKLIISLIFLGINFTLLMISIFYLNLSSIINGNGNNGDHVNTIPIFIDGNGAQNWGWAVSQPWCTGSGTYNDPFIIENLILDARGSESCIRIIDSNVRFLIRNCII